MNMVDHTKIKEIIIYIKIIYVLNLQCARACSYGAKE
jgi:hypothetical protein